MLENSHKINTIELVHNVNNFRARVKRVTMWAYLLRFSPSRMNQLLRTGWNLKTPNLSSLDVFWLYKFPALRNNSIL